MRSRSFFMTFACCLCVAAFAFGCASTLPQEDAEPQVDTEYLPLSDSSSGSLAASDGGSLYDTLKKTVVRIIQAAVELADTHEKYSGKTVEIKKEIVVDASTEPYRMEGDNTYKFSDKGVLKVKEGGALILGLGFKVEGNPATIEMEKGSKLVFLGTAIEMFKDTKIVLEGSFKCNLDVTAELLALNVNTKLDGEIDLEGSLKVDAYTFNGKEGSEVLLNMEVLASLDIGSSIKNIKDISETVFGDENGMTFNMKLNDLNVDLGGTLVSVNVSGRNSEVQVESPLGEEGFKLTKLNVMHFASDVNFLMSIMDTIHLKVSSATSEEREEQMVYSVSTFEYKAKSLAETKTDITLTFASFGLDIAERTTLTMYSGDLHSEMGTLDMDLTVLEGCYVYMGSTKYIGELIVVDPDNLSGFLEVPYRAVTHLLLGDQMDIRFAGDENAHLDIMPDLFMDTRIYPNEGYKLLEMVSDRYVEYVLDDVFSYAVPVALKGLFHAELGDKDYELYLDYELYTQVPATTIVELPTPDPPAGSVFVGWNDGAFTYTSEYEMPAHDVFLDPIWSGVYYDVSTGDDRCKITSRFDAVMINEETMEWIKEYIQRGAASGVLVQSTSFIIDIDAPTILKTEGAMSIVLNECYADMLPQYTSSVEPGLLYVVEISDENGRIETDDCKVTISLKFDYLRDNDNVVKMYSMDDLGRLTELKGTYEILEGSEEGEGRYANVTFTTESLPYCVVKSSLVQDVGPSKRMMLISLLPIVIVGLSLAIITRRRG